MARDYCKIAQQYAQDVLTGKIAAGKLVHAACQRQVDDLARWGAKGSPYTFDKKRANRICQFVELLPHIKGAKARSLIVLEPWQVFWLTTVFGWVDANGYRRFRRSYVELPRGNGKSSISSAVGLYMLCADGEGGAECYAFATTRDQARIVFNDAQNMARLSPQFRATFGVEVNAHNINQLKSASKFEALSAEGSTLDGLNTHFACIDELHAHKTRAVYDVVETSLGKRMQSLMWVITTAGTNRSGICYEVRGFALKVLKGQAEDESQFAIIYALDDGDDWATEEALIKANPNWGVSVMPDVVLSLQAKAMSMASATNNFKTKHLNEWCNADVAWMDMRAWDKCADPSLSRDNFLGKDVIVSVDLASTTDIAAKVMLFKRGEHYYVFCDSYLPRDTVDREENSQYAGWEVEGRLRVTEGSIIDYYEIEADLLSDTLKYQCLEIAYDPFQATQLSARMQKQGIQMVEMRPTVLNFSEPMKKLEGLVIDGKLHHDGDPALAWMISNVVCHYDAKDNVYPRKERPENKIDGAVALIMALGRHIAREKMPSAGMAFMD